MSVLLHGKGECNNESCYHKVQHWARPVDDSLHRPTHRTHREASDARPLRPIAPLTHSSTFASSNHQPAAQLPARRQHPTLRSPAPPLDRSTDRRRPLMSQQKGKQGKKPAKAGEGKREDVLQAVVSTTPWWGNNVEIQILMLMRPPDLQVIADSFQDRFHPLTSTSRDHGDLVSNISLEKALTGHKARKEASATNIMTVVLRSGGDDEHRTKANGITPTFVIDSKTRRCLHYDESHPLQSDHYMTLDPTIIDELSADFEVRSDFIDAQIDICTPEVLALWSESFDYELPRRNFLHGVLKDWELNGKAIYAEILEDGYAARANNLQMYEAISRDVIGRWTFPFIPDCNVLPGQSYQMRKHGVSAEDGVEFALSSRVSNAIFGKNTIVGSGSTVSGSIIGRRCTIGVNVTIEDSFIWDDVIIADGAVVRRSILGHSTVVGKKASVGEGSVLSSEVTVSDGIHLPESTVISSLAHDGKPVDPDTKLLGPRGRGTAYVDPEAEDFDDEDPAILQRSLLYNLSALSLSASSLSTLSSDLDSTFGDDDYNTSLSADESRHRLSSFASDDSGAGGKSSSSSSSFHQDAVHGLLDALRDDTGDFDSAKLEFMGLRLANDASDVQMRKAVAVAFARRAAELLTPAHGALEPAKAADAALAARSGAPSFIRESASAAASPSSASSSSRCKRPSLDVLEEEAIVAWWGDERAAAGEGMAAVRERCRVLVEWLENAEEEDDDEEDDEDDSDDE
ncbi:translation initiation factor eIF-2B subunit epsilon [Verticillium alfalfae VaMs.102]|uniref:Translation initiation factor eIF2B subunit epsilon n=1 Tax=Verticillium alfalfae (strain VaMs.102 / ATCC MYA-4576 / FGSC 10136) TaxID=526221 RepID=C9SDY8_VERA1|nr:translation initiation factor eIF-2B subunit epsilon [Verticillium alfalfae VaMs.102]EEY17235.1 translation initiation factor eIF-2B subunit epsilon [Verticillium alfalfae VaMs.102]